jgi:RND family efflux transporter MFP subunit
MLARLNTPRGRIICAVAALVVLAACYFALRPPLVTVAPVVSGEAVDVVYATGVVDFVRQARITPLVTAPIYRVQVEEGQNVRAGALLAQLEDGPQRGLAAQAEAQASTARLAFIRVDTLYRRGFASRAAWDEARGQRDAAVGAALSARARLADYAIRAPFSGTVLRRDAEPGDLATPNRVLFVIADESSLRVTADLDERDIARVVEDQAALIRADAFPGQSFYASVSEVTPQGDASTRVFRVRLRLDPEAPLRAGMTVEANIIAERREGAMLVPATAIDGEAVWTVTDGRARRHEVVVGASGEERVEIREGLALDERVVLDPPEGLRDGRRVRVRAAADE